ncbi:hypothetical protein PL8927_790074 [Planktothrix serta PCC 8927]|uniref:Uncharacterized protein n=1 Tax=Planktothrix serta PCC 8927 TaxID=671068 RepID=A0A7Z9BWA1_9CYAN|nr:hypothetical protein PL8927_790074 [Planktothrix serta PCC 8927]
MDRYGICMPETLSLSKLLDIVYHTIVNSVGIGTNKINLGESMYPTLIWWLFFVSVKFSVGLIAPPNPS